MSYTLRIKIHYNILRYIIPVKTSFQWIFQTTKTMYKKLAIVLININLRGLENYYARCNDKLTKQKSLITHVKRCKLYLLLHFQFSVLSRTTTIIFNVVVVDGQYH